MEGTVLKQMATVFNCSQSQSIGEVNHSNHIILHWGSMMIKLENIWNKYVEIPKNVLQFGHIMSYFQWPGLFFLTMWRLVGSRLWAPTIDTCVEERVHFLV